MKTYQTGAGSSASSGKDSDAASGGGGVPHAHLDVHNYLRVMTNTS